VCVVSCASVREYAPLHQQRDAPQLRLRLGLTALFALAGWSSEEKDHVVEHQHERRMAHLAERISAANR
jgi:hypothetical protein